MKHKARHISPQCTTYVAYSMYSLERFQVGLRHLSRRWTLPKITQKAIRLKNFIFGISRVPPSSSISFTKTTLTLSSKRIRRRGDKIKFQTGFHEALSKH